MLSSQRGACIKYPHNGCCSHLKPILSTVIIFYMVNNSELLDSSLIMVNVWNKQNRIKNLPET